LINQVFKSRTPATRSGPMRSACSLTRTSTTQSSRSRCSHLSRVGSRALRHEARTRRVGSILDVQEHVCGVSPARHAGSPGTSTPSLRSP